MARIVMKFGGTSMAGIERIRRVAGRVKREATPATKSRWWSRRWPARPTGWCSFCREAVPLYDPREYDVVVASGEQVTSGLLAIDAAGDGRQGALLAWAGSCRSAPTARTPARDRRHRCRGAGAP